MKSIRYLRSVSWLKTFYYNFICKSVRRDKNAYCIIHKKTNIFLNKGAHMFIHEGISVIGDIVAEPTNIRISKGCSLHLWGG